MQFFAGVKSTIMYVPAVVDADELLILLIN
jgi:hypothetical protein